MQKRNQPILVTGGAGYIGSHVCKALSDAGYFPITFDNLSSGHRWAVKWGPLEEGDILDSSRLAIVIEKYKPIAVMHFAALISVGDSVINPNLYYRNNVEGSRSLLSAMQRYEIDKIIFSSTAAIYGVPEIVPITVDALERPINPYGRSKLAVEWMLRDYAAAYNLKWIALRYFNAAGADPGGEVGEAHEPETHLIPIVLQAIEAGRGMVTVNGNDYNTADGTCVRDYIHVADLAQAHLLALHELISGGECGVFNLGNGLGYSILDVLESSERVTHRRVPVKFGPRRTGDPAILVADATRARDVLGWRPRHSELDQIISTAWDWLRKKQS